MVRRFLRLLLIGVLLAHAAAACDGGPETAELNPQPLPPKDTDNERGGGTTSSGGNEGTSASGAPNTAVDAGSDGDAATKGDQ